MPFNTTPVEGLGFVAAFCSTAAFVPQLARVIRLRSARDISLPTFLLFSVGVFLWLVYGINIGSKPVIISNAVTLVLSLSILILKLRYGSRPTQGFDADELQP
jgi:MtN3 and saliva related transmembrane protein